MEEHSYDLKDSVPSPDLVLDKDNLQKAIHEIMDSLPEKCREVFRLSRMEGLSHKEISEKLDISKKTIENHMTRALKTLRIELKKKDFLIGIFILIKLDLLVGATAYL